MQPTQHNRKMSNEKYIRRWLDETSPANRPDAEAFDTLKLGQGVRSSSRLHYARYLCALDNATNGKAWKDIDDRDSALFMAKLRLASYSDDSLRTTASFLKHFLKWVRGDSQLPYRMLLAFRTKKNRNLPERPVLTEAEQQLLMDAAPSMRDQVMVALLVEGGFRINECVNLNVDGAAFDDKGGAWIAMPPMDEGLKTGPRRVYIAKYANLVHAYLALHPNRAEANAPLLLSYDNRRNLRPGCRLGCTGAWLALNRLQRKTGIRHFRPHDLRHTAITRAHEAGLDGIDLSERFWSSKNSREAQRYIHHSQEHKERRARLAAGVDPNGNPLPSSDETQQKLQQLRKLWAELMGTDLPKQSA